MRMSGLGSWQSLKGNGRGAEDAKSQKPPVHAIETLSRHLVLPAHSPGPRDSQTWKRLRCACRACT